MPITSGCTPALAPPTYRPRGSRPSDASASSLTSSRAAAPSLSGEELPAVTVPPARNTGLSAASFASDVSARMPSSASTTHRRRATGRSSAAKSPRAVAAAARWWLRSANASCRSRSMPCRAATSSAVSPIASTPCRSRIRGLVSRQPSRVSNSSIARGMPSSGRGSTNGARVIDSEPPASTMSASPAPIARAAVVTASSPEAHSRLTRGAGHAVSGSPASSTAIRATLRLSSPAWLAAPQ